MSKQEVILCESLETSLSRAIEQCPHRRAYPTSLPACLEGTPRIERCD